MAGGTARIALEWALSRPGFTLEGMVGSLNFVAADVIRKIIADAERAGAVKRV